MKEKLHLLVPGAILSLSIISLIWCFFPGISTRIQSGSNIFITSVNVFKVAFGQGTALGRPLLGALVAIIVLFLIILISAILLIFGITKKNVKYEIAIYLILSFLGLADIIHFLMIKVFYQYKTAFSSTYYTGSGAIFAAIFLVSATLFAAFNAYRLIENKRNKGKK